MAIHYVLWSIYWPQNIGKDEYDLHGTYGKKKFKFDVITGNVKFFTVYINYELFESTSSILLSVLQVSLSSNSYYCKLLWEGKKNNQKTKKETHIVGLNSVCTIILKYVVWLLSHNCQFCSSSWSSWRPIPLHTGLYIILKAEEHNLFVTVTCAQTTNSYSECCLGCQIVFKKMPLEAANQNTKRIPAFYQDTCSFHGGGEKGEPTIFEWIQDIFLNLMFCASSGHFSYRLYLKFRSVMFIGLKLEQRKHFVTILLHAHPSNRSTSKCSPKSHAAPCVETSSSSTSRAFHVHNTWSYWSSENAMYESLSLSASGFESEW